MLKRYLKDTSGNIAMMFGIASTLLLLGVGVAVDYSAMTKKKTKYQGYADVAVLAASGSGETKKGKLKKIAKDAVAGNNFDGEPLDVNVKITSKDRVQVVVSSAHKTSFMGMFGQSTVRIAAQAESPLSASEPVDIALVLDTTGSMKGSKLDSLKDAAKELVDILDDFENGAVRVSVIPFRDYVNIGKSRRNEPWLDVDDDSVTFGAEKCVMKKDVIRKYNCVTTPVPTKTCYNDGVAYTCGGGTKTTCDKEYGPEYEKCYTPKSTKTWHGCVGSRTTPWNERAHKGSANIPGLMNIKCGKQILALTSDLDKVEDKIDSLTAKGKTYLPSGLVWGWRAIHPDQPLTEASSVQKNDKTSVLIFMTDGANTISQKGNYHNGKDVANADHITKQLCNGIKSDGIEIYTVAYDFEAANTISMLKKCASKQTMFYKAKNADELADAFKEIGEDLFRLRISN